MRTSDIDSVNSLIKSNDFSDSFESLTFFVGEKTNNNELKNIFIRDENNTFKIELKSAKDEYLPYCGVYVGSFTTYKNNIVTLLTIEK